VSRRLMWSLVVATVVSMLVLQAVGALRGDESKPPPVKAIDQQGEEQLQLRAYNLVGLAGLPRGAALADSGVVEVVVGHDSTSPFIAERIDGRHVWRVSYGKVLLEFEKWTGSTVRPRQYRLDVYFDSATGQLLKISLLNDQHDTSLVKKPSAKCAEEQLGNTARSLPKEDPATSLIQVLGNIPQCPLLATEITAYYWMMKLYGEDSEFQPVWEVMLYGSPYYRFKPDPGESLSERSYVRWLVNATTGRAIISSNSPSPMSPECDTSAPREGQGLRVLETKEQALEQALQYSGFLRSPGFVVPDADSAVVLRPEVDSTTPFLSDSISGPKRWVVRFDSVFLDVGNWVSEVRLNQIRKTYYFVLDPPTGRLLKVYSIYKGTDVDLPPEPLAESSAAYLSLNERYVSLVGYVPPVSLYQALGAAVASNPLKAKEIHAWLVMLSLHDQEPIPCWIIVAKGTAPFPKPSAPSLSPATQEPRLSSTRIRCAINAVTGKGLFCQG